MTILYVRNTFRVDEGNLLFNATSRSFFSYRRQACFVNFETTQGQEGKKWKSLPINATLQNVRPVSFVLEKSATS